MGKISRSRAGFSLIELLVVIGIIAVLVGILIPTLASARRQANLLQCASNLRQVFQGSMLHVQEHGGYLPLAGNLNIAAVPWSGSETYSAALGDAPRKRYTYASQKAQMVHMVAPMPGAIAQYLGWRNLSFDDWYVLDQELNNTRGVWQMFMCPETDALERYGANSANSTGTGQGLMMVLSANGAANSWWATNSDFAMNEGILGFDYHTEYKPRRLAGKLSYVQRPAETMLFCDAKLSSKLPPNVPFNLRCPWITMAPALTSTGAVTLADVLAQNSLVEQFRAEIDQRRHRGRVNVCFADGHVETVYIGAKSLERIYLIAK